MSDNSGYAARGDVRRAWLCREFEALGGERRVGGGWSQAPMMSVIMPVHNGAEHVGRSIESILGQTFQDFELIIVDDASSDRTLETVASYDDERVRVLRMLENQGPYVCKNIGICHARGRMIGLQDADDVSGRYRLEKQSGILASMPGTLVCSVQYQRIGEDGRPVLNRGKYNRRSYQSLTFLRRQVVGRIGFFDSVRAAADDEFWKRLCLLLPKESLYDIEEPHYFAQVRSGSLSDQQVDIGVGAGGDNEGGQFLSEERQEYVNSYKRWHEVSSAPLMAFPLRDRPFAVPESLEPSFGYKGASESVVVGSVSSIPEREAGLRRVVERVLPQFDRLFVYLNGYRGVPGFLDHPRIDIARSEEHGDLSDNGKFFFCSALTGHADYHFTLDDDIDYPENYVSYLLSKLGQYGDRVVVGVHGSIVKDGFVDYYDADSRAVLKYDEELVEDEEVHLLGTGTVAYPRSLVSPRLEDFETQGMADLWFATFANNRSVPLVSVARGRNYLRDIPGLPECSLFRKFEGVENAQSRFIRERLPWCLPGVGR